MFTTALVACLIRPRKGAKASALWSGLPVWGSRACRCRMAAPASAAPMAAAAISSGVIGRWSDIVGVWIAPVTAQVMITLSGAGMGSFSYFLGGATFLGGQRHQPTVTPCLSLCKIFLRQGRAAHRLYPVQSLAAPVGGGQPGHVV